MYPRNNASPERIAVGQVVLISDGTIQSSGVSITVRGQGGAEAASGGTIAYGADNTVYYTPTQAETNFTSFVVIASKASCFSASQTIVTTAASTAGQVDVKSIAGTAQTANDNGADLALITGADGVALASTQQSITFQPIEITAGDAIPNILLSGSGSEDGISFTRSGSGDPFDANFIGQINATVDTALTDYDAATGTELAATEAKIDTIDTNVDAVLVDTGTTIPATLAAQDAIITEARLAELDAANLPADIAAIPTVAEILTTQMTEAYAADGTAPTLAEAIFMINSTLNEFSITGTTITSYKLDGTTVAATHTLDSATVPTSRTRSS